jgi:hypothetical protein
VPLGRRQRFHRKRVNFFAHPVAQRRINDLMSCNARLAVKCLRDDHRLKVCAVSFNCELFTVEFVAQIAFDLGGSNHVNGCQSV